MVYCSPLLFNCFFSVCNCKSFQGTSALIDYCQQSRAHSVTKNEFLETVFMVISMWDIFSVCRDEYDANRKGDMSKNNQQNDIFLATRKRSNPDWAMCPPGGGRVQPGPCFPVEIQQPCVRRRPSLLCFLFAFPLPDILCVGLCPIRLGSVSTYYSGSASWNPAGSQRHRWKAWEPICPNRIIPRFWTFRAHESSGKNNAGRRPGGEQSAERTDI